MEKKEDLQRERLEGRREYLENPVSLNGCATAVFQSLTRQWLQFHKSPVSAVF
jgi:hypothetical protein